MLALLMIPAFLAVPLFGGHGATFVLAAIMEPPYLVGLYLAWPGIVLTVIGTAFRWVPARVAGPVVLLLSIIACYLQLAGPQEIIYGGFIWFSPLLLLFVGWLYAVRRQTEVNTGKPTSGAI
ncbi:hypothetical protein H0E84_15055 [Luteimonas sp. SJ-92]|uniref:Uncharacterized protein n=1 Tax=Luteimonas salinisoli TaxID=2752307 RepID=A0A853JGZ3_9GAMM|nr:hypothetical protein [Luteimonas salinisoli]NZA27698.1 hypothetical protein [Luteimonas salinisoli]